MAIALIAGLVTAYAGFRAGLPGQAVALLLAMSVATTGYVLHRRAG